MSDRNLWAEVLEELELQMTKATFETWFVDTSAELDDDTLTVTVPTGYAKDWLENRLLATIERTVNRVAGRSIGVAFTVAQPTDEGDHEEPTSTPSTEPRPGEVAVELVEFDPTKRGFVMAANYAVRFWQPYLAACEREAGARSGGVAFALWLTLRSFAYHADRDAWPSIQTLADTCANGNRHAILGRAAYEGHKRRIGALEVLEDERIVWVKRRGSGRSTSYRFRVLDSLPLLTPSQVQELTSRLQSAHQRFIQQCDLDREEWEQLTLPSLTNVSRT